MTTVAYKAGIMAGDSCWSYGGAVDTLSRKIHRLKSGALLGQAGDNDARDIIAMLENVKTPAALPTRRALLDTRIDFFGLLVFPKGRIFKISSSNLLPENTACDVGVWEVQMPFTAVGSGSEIALGAMAAGRSAKDAVAIACRYDTASRPPVYEVPLQKNPELRHSVAAW